MTSWAAGTDGSRTTRSRQPTHRHRRRATRPRTISVPADVFAAVEAELADGESLSALFSDGARLLHRHRAGERAVASYESEYGPITQAAMDGAGSGGALPARFRGTVPPAEIVEEVRDRMAAEGRAGYLNEVRWRLCEPTGTPDDGARRLGGR